MFYKVIGAWFQPRLRVAVLALLLVFSASLQIAYSKPVPPSGPAHSFYLNCSAGHDGTGSKKSPWNSLASVNAFEFHAGDRLLIKRRTVCIGALTPKGSGTPEASIILDAYGSGSLPVINGGTNEAALKLFNQQYWEINSLEIIGGTKYGVYVSGDIPNSTISHIYLRNLDVHGATYDSTKRADSGEVFIFPNGPGQVLNDIMVDGVRAHDTHVSQGIFVSAGGAWIEKPGVSQPLGNNITVQNSTVHDVGGDGILIAELTNGLLQRNVVYRSGLCRKCTGSTPVGLWEWYCHRCTVQYNESYSNESWDGDGGDFDIDYFNDDNIVQYNYGHDSAGYCIAFFGAGGRASHNNVFRFNVCSNNGRRPDLSRQGEVFLHTWDDGSLDGVEIYNNTFYWNPAANAPAFNSADTVFSGNGSRIFENNIIYSTVPDLIHTSNFTLDNNLYWTTASASPTFHVNGVSYSNFSTYQTVTGQDVHSYYTDPKLVDSGYHTNGRPTTAFRLMPGSPAFNRGVDICKNANGCSMGSEDFWAHPLSGRHGYSIGADQAP